MSPEEGQAVQGQYVVKITELPEPRTRKSPSDLRDLAGVFAMIMITCFLGIIVISPYLGFLIGKETPQYLLDFGSRLLTPLLTLEGVAFAFYFSHRRLRE